MNAHSHDRIPFPTLSQAMDSITQSDGSIFQHGVFGSDSKLCIELRKIVPDTILAEYLRDYGATKDLDLDAKQRARANFLADLLDAAAVIRGHIKSVNIPSTIESDCSTVLQSAMKGLQEAFPDDVEINLPDAPEKGQSPSIVDRMLHLCKPRAPAHYWIARDLLMGWCEDSYQNDSKFSATLPIVSVTNANSGRALWLTVELFRNTFPSLPGSLIPDLRYLGLTKIGSTEEQSFYKSTQIVWQLSGLSDTGWTGRWRIETKTPTWISAEENNAGNSRTDEVEKEHFPAEYWGRSADAAILCVLLAASGNPYGDTGRKPQDSAESLVHDCVITGQLGENPENKPAIDLQILPVKDDSFPDKLDACQLLKMKRVLFAAEQPFGQEILRVNKETARSGSFETLKYHDVDLIRVKTIADALDELLVENRWLKRIHEQGRTSWLAHWRFYPVTRTITQDDGQEIAETVYRSTGQSEEDDEVFTWEQVQKLQEKADQKAQPEGSKA